MTNYIHHRKEKRDGNSRLALGYAALLDRADDETWKKYQALPVNQENYNALRVAVFCRHNDVEESFDAGQWVTTCETCGKELARRDDAWHYHINPIHDRIGEL